MGACCSKDQEQELTPEEITRRQRRKLSVAPSHVADSAGQHNMGGAPGDDHTHTQTHTAVVQKNESSGKIKNVSLSRKGLVPYSKKKYNQDRAVVKYAMKKDAGISLFGVMDGHGEFGHHVSAFVQDKLPVCIEAHDIRGNPEEAILQGVKATVDKLARTDINLDFSGTTCVFGLIVDDKIYCANIGDSRGVVLRHDGSTVSAIPISFDQKPENAKEKERILAAGGRVEPLPGAPGEDCGPHRVWLADVDVPGLAMSRSIGDEVSQTVGVISVPEIVTHDVHKDDLLAVWASDGVWEFITNEEAIQILWDHRKDLKKAAEALVEESTRRWREEEEVIDDITCVIIEFPR